MAPNEPDTYWQIVMTHEAGHAVADLAIHGVAADIFVKATPTESHPFRASYRYKTSLNDALSDNGDVLGAIIIMAAGAKAEAICLGITESGGFPGDRANINNLRAAWENKCNDAQLRSSPLPEDVMKRELSKIPQFRVKLEEITNEIESDFKRTATIITENRNVLEVIAGKAYECVQSIGEQNLSEGRILLSADQIRELWSNERRN